MDDMAQKAEFLKIPPGLWTSAEKNWKSLVLFEKGGRKAENVFQPQKHQSNSNSSGLAFGEKKLFICYLHEKKQLYKS